MMQANKQASKARKTNKTRKVSKATKQEARQPVRPVKEPTDQLADQPILTWKNGQDLQLPYKTIVILLNFLSVQYMLQSQKSFQYC
jgi:hypothetical protein